MYIEESIDRLIDAYNEASDLAEDGMTHRYAPIGSWKWQGPRTFPDAIHQQIERLVKEASVNECMTSSSEYIRALKRWLSNT